MTYNNTNKLNSLLAECIKCATIYAQTDHARRSVIGMLCNVLEADSPSKLRTAWNIVQNDMRQYVDSIVVQEMRDEINGLCN